MRSMHLDRNDSITMHGNFTGMNTVSPSASRRTEHSKTMNSIGQFPVHGSVPSRAKSPNTRSSADVTRNLLDIGNNVTHATVTHSSDKIEHTSSINTSPKNNNTVSNDIQQQQRSSSNNTGQESG